MYIYKTINIENGRVYIGKSEKNDFNFNYYGSGMLIKRSIMKHGGTDHLMVEMIEVCDTIK